MDYSTAPLFYWVSACADNALKLKVQLTRIRPTPADDADLTQRVILEGASRVPINVVFLVLFALLYLMFIFGGYPSTSPEYGFSFTFLHNHMKISFMSIFARFM